MQDSAKPAMLMRISSGLQDASLTEGRVNAPEEAGHVVPGHKAKANKDMQLSCVATRVVLAYNSKTHLTSLRSH